MLNPAPQARSGHQGVCFLSVAVLIMYYVLINENFHFEVPQGSSELPFGFLNGNPQSAFSPAA
jgi:hypothetical protein